MRRTSSSAAIGRNKTSWLDLVLVALSLGLAFLAFAMALGFAGAAQ